MELELGGSAGTSRSQFADRIGRIAVAAGCMADACLAPECRRFGSRFPANRLRLGQSDPEIRYGTNCAFNGRAFNFGEFPGRHLEYRADLSVTPVGNVFKPGTGQMFDACPV